MLLLLRLAGRVGTGKNGKVVNISHHFQPGICACANAATDEGLFGGCPKWGIQGGVTRERCAIIYVTIIKQLKLIFATPEQRLLVLKWRTFHPLDGHLYALLGVAFPAHLLLFRFPRNGQKNPTLVKRCHFVQHLQHQSQGSRNFNLSQEKRQKWSPSPPSSRRGSNGKHIIRARMKRINSTGQKCFLPCQTKASLLRKHPHHVKLHQQGVSKQSRRCKTFDV